MRRTDSNMATCVIPLIVYNRAQPRLAARSIGACDTPAAQPFLNKRVIHNRQCGLMLIDSKEDSDA